MSERLKLFIPFFIFLLLAIAFFSLQMRRSTGDFDPNALPSARVGQVLPEFSLSNLRDESEMLTVDSLPGTPYLLNVWATWCVSCRVEHAYLNELAELGVVIVGLNYKDERDAAIKWLARLGDPYKINLFDENGSLGLDLGVYGAPETYVIDGDGVVRYRHVGVMDEKVWQRKIIPLGISW